MNVRVVSNKSPPRRGQFQAQTKSDKCLINLPTDEFMRESRDVAGFKHQGRPKETLKSPEAVIDKRRKTDLKDPLTSEAETPYQNTGSALNDHAICDAYGLSSCTYQESEEGPLFSLHSKEEIVSSIELCCVSTENHLSDNRLLIILSLGKDAKMDNLMLKIEIGLA